MSKPRHFMLMTAGPVGSFPAPNGSSVAMTLWAVARRLQAAGHRVSVCYIPIMYSPTTPDESAEFERRAAALERLGIGVDLVPVPVVRRRRWTLAFRALRMVFAARMTDFFPELALRERLRAICAARRPDVIYHHGVTTLAAVDDPTVPAAVLLGDLEEELIRYRWQLTPKSSVARYCYRLCLWLGSRRLPQRRAELFQQCRCVIVNARRAATVLATQGVRAEYMPTPCAVNDLGGVSLAADAGSNESRVPRILMVGHLLGTPTQLALHFFGDHVLPALERRLGSTGFEVHIVGRDQLPTQLLRKLRRPSIRLRGYVDDLIAEYRQTDVMLTVTPVPTGTRTRIAEALSAGCCIVVHRAESAGMPELVHEENVLWGSDGESIADMVVRALHDPSLRRRLGEKARATYLQAFAPAVSLTRLVDRITATAE